MNLIRQIINWLRGKQNEAAEAIFKANVENNSQIAIDNAEDKIGEYKTKLANLIASNKDIDNKIEAKKRKIEEILDIAKKAKAKGEKEEAVKAIEIKNRYTEELKSLEKDSELNQKVINQSKTKIEELTNKVAKAIRDRSRLISQRNNAQIRQSFADTENGIGDNFLDDLNMLEKEVSEQENLAFAKEELAQIGSKNEEEELKKKYSSNSQSVDDEYANL